MSKDRESMNLLASTLFSLLMGAFVNLSAVTLNTITSPQDAQSPEAVVKEFYRWYIHSISKGPDPFKQGKPTLRQYVTAKLIRGIERAEKTKGLDADYFIQSQEWDGDWEHTIKVSKAQIKGGTATVIVTVNALRYPRVRVSLVDENGVWKINKVENAPTRIKGID
jgi:hypothetical protein